MRKHRTGLSALTGLLVVVIIVAAAFYVTIPMVGSSPTTTSPLTTSGSTSGAPTSSSSGPSTGTLTLNVAQPLVVAPDVNETVSMTFAAIGTVSGSYALSASSLPKGVSIAFKPSSVSLPAQLSSTVTLTLSAATGAAVGNSTVNLLATAGSSVFTRSLPLMSVQALVLIQGNAFIPSTLNVAAGTKVYWLNLDLSVNPDIGPNMHDVTALDHSFSSGTGNLGQYDLYSHVFATAGTVKYQSAAQPSMTGQVVVS